MMRHKTLITGGAGFIGLHLIHRLLDEGLSDILVLDNFSRGRKDDELDRVLGSPQVKCVSADLSDPGALDSLGDDFDQIYHFAAIIGVKNVLEHPDRVVRVNALSMLHLLDWAVRLPKKPRIVFASTSEVYAWTKNVIDLPVPTPEDIPLALTDLSNPRSSYAGSKIFGELAIHHYSSAHGIPFGIVRYHNVYGPRMGYEHVIPELHERVLAGQNPLTVYSAHHRRAFCHVRDAVESTFRVMNYQGGSAHTFNVGNPAAECSIGELALSIARLAGCLSITIKEEKAANDPVVRRSPDISRVKELLGFQPSVTLEEGLKDTLAWYATHPRPSR